MCNSNERAVIWSQLQTRLKLSTVVKFFASGNGSRKGKKEKTQVSTPGTRRSGRGARSSASRVAGLRARTEFKQVVIDEGKSAGSNGWL